MSLPSRHSRRCKPDTMHMCAHQKNNLTYRLLHHACGFTSSICLAFCRGISIDRSPLYIAPSISKERLMNQSAFFDNHLHDVGQPQAVSPQQYLNLTLLALCCACMCMYVFIVFVQADLSEAQSTGLGFGTNPGIDGDAISIGQSQGTAGVSLLPVDRVVPAITDTYISESGQELPVCMHVGGGPTGFSPLSISKFPVHPTDSYIFKLHLKENSLFESLGPERVRRQGIELIYSNKILCAGSDSSGKTLLGSAIWSL